MYPPKSEEEAYENWMATPDDRCSEMSERPSDTRVVQRLAWAIHRSECLDEPDGDDLDPWWTLVPNYDNCRGAVAAWDAMTWTYPIENPVRPASPQHERPAKQTSDHSPAPTD